MRKKGSVAWPLAEKEPTHLQENPRQSPQVFLNGEIHNWYRLVLGYSDRAVAFIIDRLKIGPQDTVIDPFCGAGTTLVECMKRGISCIGVDANPSSCFAARVKTDWALSPRILTGHLARIEHVAGKCLKDKSTLEADATFRYIRDSGMLERGWINRAPLKTAVAIKMAIRSLPIAARYRNALMLALVDEVVRGASNVKFGPELYCGPAKHNLDVFESFADRVRIIASDLKLARPGAVRAEVYDGDARDLRAVLDGRRRFGAVISSPPYPAEHDYTRNSRLELAFLEHVVDRDSLRVIKRSMVRCHTKGIYADDSDDAQVARFRSIDALADRIQKRTVGKTHKFAPLYPVVVKQYFGGMKRHLTSIWPFLRPGAKCAYVVGDQAGYLRVPIQTADLLATVAKRLGYRIIDLVRWRESRAKSHPTHENILIIAKPATR